MLDALNLELQVVSSLMWVLIELWFSGRSTDALNHHFSSHNHLLFAFYLFIFAFMSNIVTYSHTPNSLPGILLT